MSTGIILKQDFALYYLSLQLALGKEGDRLPSVIEISKTLDLSTGIVQKAFHFLKSCGAIQIENRGHMGAYIQSLNSNKLREINYQQAFFCTMPLPYTLRYEALATALAKIFTPYVPLNFIHSQGASRRMEFVDERRADCAIVSVHAWENSQFTDLEPIFYFGEGSYLSRHVLVLRDGCQSKDVKKVGVDARSPDHQILTESFFGLKVSYKEMNYLQIITEIRKGDIDAAILNYDEDKVHFFKTEELTDSVLVRKMREAVLLIRKDNKRMKVACSLLNKEVLDQYYNDVLNGSQLPNY